MNSFVVQVATSIHERFADEICELIEVSARQRGTGIAKRSPEYIRQKMIENKAIIALLDHSTLVGFCYIETWSDKQYVANSGLVVHPDYRSTGVATRIKKKAFEHSKKLYPEASLFGLTTSLPVMKINSVLGYTPVTYDKLTSDDAFWNGCKSCVNYEILMSKNKSNCMCTAMLFDPKKNGRSSWNFMKKSKIYERFMRLKKKRLTKKITKS
ncbi:MAG: GNAT family N-acetyltransferase [Cyclobacteriaceae bacterium]